MSLFSLILIIWFGIGFLNGLWSAIYGEMILDEGFMSRVGAFLLGLVLGPIGVVMAILHEMNHRV